MSIAERANPLPSAQGKKATAAWLVLFLLTTLSTLSYIDRSIISLLVDQIRADLKVTDLQIGLVNGLAFGLFYAAFSLPTGWLVDRFPRRYVLAPGFAIWTIATACCGLANSYWHLFLARFGVGAGEATLGPAAFSLISDLFNRDKLAGALSIFAWGTAIGNALALIAGGAIIAVTLQLGTIDLPLIGVVHPWQLAFMLVSVPALVLLIPITLLREPARGTSGQDDAATWAELWVFMREHRANLAMHFFGFGLMAVLAFGSIAWVPAFFMRKVGLDVGVTGLTVGLVNGICGVAGLVFVGSVVDALFKRGMKDAHFRFFMVSAPLMSVVMCAGFWLLPGHWTSLLAWAVLHFLYPFSGAAAAHIQIITPPRLRGRVSAMYIFAYNFMGLCLGPTLVAFFTESIFHDPASVGKSIALLNLLLGPTVALIFFLNRKNAVRAVEMAEHRSTGTMAA